MTKTTNKYSKEVRERAVRMDLDGVGTIDGHGADLYVFWNLIQQFRQNGAVTVATWGEFHRPEVRRGRNRGQMDLAPLASALNAGL